MLDLAKPRLMAILNLSPDSFSDGGQWFNTKQVVEGVRIMLEQGADIIDVGGESTRPGSQRVSAKEQKNRVLDTIIALREHYSDVPISIDTTLSNVAEAALDAGADMLNDISAGRDDPEMLALAAERQVPICLMHMQGEPSTMQDSPQYEDVVREVSRFLLERATEAETCGVARESIILDPGIGFGKTTEHNLTLIKHLDAIATLPYPILLGTSRKRFMGRVCHADEPRQRVPASCATTVLGLQAGVKIFRVHDIWQHRQVIDLMTAL